MLIEMNGFSVRLQRKQVKNINLRIKRTGEVQISAPIKISIDVIYNFLNQKRTWIEINRQRLLELQQKEKSQNLIEGEYVKFQGEKYLLFFHETMTNQRIELNENQMHFFVKPEAKQAENQWLLEKWYHFQMEQVCQSLFYKWKPILDISDIQVSIKKMKSRWGSCHPIKKHITLNLRLIEKPLSCLEYVIVHELVHLFEASHNKRFYALMSNYLPDWEKIKKQLSEFA